MLDLLLRQQFPDCPRSLCRPSICQFRGHSAPCLCFCCSLFRCFRGRSGTRLLRYCRCRCGSLFRRRGRARLCFCHRGCIFLSHCFRDCSGACLCCGRFLSRCRGHSGICCFRSGHKNIEHFLIERKRRLRRERLVRKQFHHMSRCQIHLPHECLPVGQIIFKLCRHLLRHREAELRHLHDGLHIGIRIRADQLRHIENALSADRHLLLHHRIHHHKRPVRRRHLRRRKRVEQNRIADISKLGVRADRNRLPVIGAHLEKHARALL